MTKVFVYGTLKKGRGNHGLLSSSKFLGVGQTTSNIFNMYDGGFPYVTFGGRYSIEGELYEVDDDTLKNLDRLEGVDYDHYTRNIVSIFGKDIDFQDAHIYVASENVRAGLEKNSSSRLMKPSTLCEIEDCNCEPISW